MPKKKNNGSTPQAGGSSEQRRALTERLMRYTNLCTMSSCAIPGASSRVAAERQSIQTALDAGVEPAVSNSSVEAAIMTAALKGVDGSWSAQQVFEAVRAVQCSVRDSVQDGDSQPPASAEETAAENVEEPQEAAEQTSPKNGVVAPAQDGHDEAVTAAGPVQHDVPPAKAHGTVTGLPASGGRAEERQQLRHSMFEFVNLCSMVSCFTSPGIQARLKKARETVRNGLEKKITPLDPDTNPGDRRVLEIARQGAAGEKTDKEIHEALLEEKNADTQGIDPARRDGETPQPDSASTKAAIPQEQASPPPPNEKARSETSAPASAPQAPCVPEPALTSPVPAAASDPAPACVVPAATSAAKADQEALRAKLLRFANMCTLATKMPSAAIDAHIAATRVAIRADLDNGVALSPSGDHAERECLDVALRGVRGDLSPAEVHSAVIGATPTGAATTSASPAPEPKQTTASKQTAPPQAKVKKPPTVETKVAALRQARARCDQRFDRRNVQRVCDALSAFTAGDVQSMSEGDAKRALEGIVDANGYTNEKFDKESQLMGRVPTTVRLLFEKTGVSVPRPDIDGMFSDYVVEFLKSCSTSVFLNRDETPIDELLDNFRRWWHDTKVHHPVLTPAELKQAGKTLAANPPTGLTVVNIKGELRVRKAAQVATLSPDPQALKDTAAPQPDVKALRALAMKAVRASPPYALSKAALLESFGKAQKSTVTETAKKRAWKDIVASPPDGFEIVKEDGELKLRWTEAPATPQSTAKTANNGTTSAKKTPAANKTAPTPVDRAAKQKASAAKEVAKATPTATSPVSESPPVSAVETDAAESSGGDEDYDETAPPEQLLLRAVTTMCGGVGNVIGKKSDAIKKAQHRFPFLTETALKKAWKVLVDDGCVKVTDGTAALHRTELLPPPVPLSEGAVKRLWATEAKAKQTIVDAETASRISLLASYVEAGKKLRVEAEPAPAPEVRTKTVPSPKPEPKPEPTASAEPSVSSELLMAMYLAEETPTLAALILVRYWAELPSSGHTQPCTKANVITRAAEQRPIHPLFSKKKSKACREALEQCVKLKYFTKTETADGLAILTLSPSGRARVDGVTEEWLASMQDSDDDDTSDDEDSSSDEDATASDGGTSEEDDTEEETSAPHSDPMYGVPPAYAPMNTGARVASPVASEVNPFALPSDGETFGGPRPLALKKAQRHTPGPASPLDVPYDPSTVAPAIASTNNAAEFFQKPNEPSARETAVEQAAAAFFPRHA